MELQILQKFALNLNIKLFMYLLAMFIQDQKGNYSENSALNQSINMLGLKLGGECAVMLV